MRNLEDRIVDPGFKGPDEEWWIISSYMRAGKKEARWLIDT